MKGASRVNLYDDITHELGIVASAVYGVIEDHAGGGRGCWVTNAVIGARLKIAARTVQDAKRKLEDAGLIRRAREERNGRQIWVAYPTRPAARGDAAHRVGGARLAACKEPPKETSQETCPPTPSLANDQLLHERTPLQLWLAMRELWRRQFDSEPGAVLTASGKQDLEAVLAAGHERGKVLDELDAFCRLQRMRFDEQRPLPRSPTRVFASYYGVWAARLLEAS